LLQWGIGGTEGTSRNGRGHAAGQGAESFPIGARSPGGAGLDREGKERLGKIRGRLDKGYQVHSTLWGVLARGSSSEREILQGQITHKRS